MGIVTRCSTSCADAPGMFTNTSSMGTTICGSSSRGVCQMLKSPNDKAATITSGVRGESIKPCAIFPASPRFTDASPRQPALRQSSFHQAPGCLDSPPPHLRHSVRTAVRPDSLYLFQGSRPASASDLRHLQHKSRTVGLGSPVHRSAPPGQASLLAQNTLGRTSPTAIQSLWASPHAPLRCVTQDPLRLQSPPPCPVETSVPSRPTEHEPGHSSLPLPALRRAAWPRVDSVTCPPPRTAAFPAKPMIPVPPIA